MTTRGTKAGKPHRTKAERTKGRNSTRRLAVVTGTRAEYGLLKSTMTELARQKNVVLQVVVTGAHLLAKFGHTVEEIETDGWSIDARIPMQRGDDSPLDQAEGIASGVAGLAGFFHQNATDIVLVLGDRIEAMAAALAAVTTGKALAHVHGGDLAAGDLDDRLRHAISKLAHLHYAATREAAQRLIRMGEDRRRVRVVGAPGLDHIRDVLDLSRAEAKAGSARGVRRAMVVQHPCGRSADRERETMNRILRACEQESLSVSCVYPNTDAGHGGILAAIEDRRRSARDGAFRAFASLPRDEFLRAMKEADLLIGNSSSGIIESAFVGTPAVNIGDRQKGRQVCGPSVVHSPEETAAIRQAIRKALRIKTIKPGAAYGDGRSGRRIAAHLAQVPLDDALLRKVNAY